MRVKRKVSMVCAMALTLSLLAGCGGSTNGTSPYSEMVGKYYDAIDNEYAYGIAETLAYDETLLSNELGFRTAGSDAEHAAADYLMSEMKNLGLQDVEKIPVTVDKWQFNGASLKVGRDEAIFYPASYATSGTDSDGIKAEIVDVGTGFAADYEGKDVQGKIVLAGVDQWNEAWIDGYMREADLRGAAAIITYDIGGYAAISDDAINMQDVCAPDLIPCVSISAEDGTALKQQVEAGDSNATLVVDNEVDIDGGTSYNVVGKIPGKSSDEQIIVSGHYDVYFNGFQDDSAAVALCLSMAKAMIDSGYEPENDILFVAHGSEEWGASNSQNDWTTGSYELINNARPEWAEKTKALLNFELPALYSGDDIISISSVPEFASFVTYAVNDMGLFEEIDTSIFKDGISDESIPTNTLEDGMNYRFAGIPYLINKPEQEGKWIQDRYHTKYDNAETWSEEVMDINVKMFGAMAIYIDQSPAMPMDFVSTATALKDTFDEAVAETSGADATAYAEAVSRFESAATAFKIAGDELNTAYETALSENDAEKMAAIREEGKAYNDMARETFKKVQDELIGLVATSEIVFKHEPAAKNISAIEGILTAIEKEELGNEEGTGALDLAWSVNGATDYYYYIFSKDVAEASQSLLSDGKNPENTFWGFGKVDPMANTGVGILSLFAGDFAGAASIYEDALDWNLGLYKMHVTEETEAVTEITDLLETY